MEQVFIALIRSEIPGSTAFKVTKVITKAKKTKKERISIIDTFADNLVLKSGFFCRFFIQNTLHIIKQRFYVFYLMNK